MIHGFTKCMVVAFVAVFAIGAQAIQYTTGIEQDGKTLVGIAYQAIPLNEGKTIEMLKKGEIGESTLKKWNNNDKLGKIATLTLAAETKFGGEALPAGEYTAGINVSKNGKFSLVVWQGEGDDATADPIPVELIPNEIHNDHLTLSLVPGEEESGSYLIVLYGKYVSMVPVSAGAGGKAGSASSKEKGDDGALLYSSGCQIDGESLVHVAYSPTPYAKGETFKKLLDGEYTQDQLDEWWNGSPKFGKVGKISLAKSAQVGQLPAPAGEYVCGLNADIDGKFSFVGWADGEAHRTPLKLESHEYTIPNLVMSLSPAGEKGSNLRILYGQKHADMSISLGGTKAGSGSSK